MSSPLLAALVMANIVLLLHRLHFLLYRHPNEEEDKRYTIFTQSHGGWDHYGWRDTEEEAMMCVRAHLERGYAAFYVPMETEPEVFEEWALEVCPAA